MRAPSLLILLAAPLLACVALSGCSQPPANAATANAATASAATASAATAGPNTPGWTGKTFVLGNTSTVAGDAAATELQQKWPLERH